MKHWQLLIVIILSGLLLGCATSSKDQSYLQEYGFQGGRGQGFRSYPYLTEHEAHTCLTGEVSGRITILRVEKLAPDLEPGLAMDIQTPDRGLVHVHCGPLGLLDSQETDLKPGDQVTVKVYCAKLAGKETLVAGEIKHAAHTMVLQDAQGTPYWATMPEK
jgi:hypothetical protein